MSKIIYMGTPEFAVPPLKAMAAAGYEIPMVVTQPDKAKDRGKKVQPTPVKAAAEYLGIPVSQPERIKNNPDFMERLLELSPDLIVVAAYGKILPKELLELPGMGCINIHASLLPRFRGAAPIQRAILEGDKETGITLMHMAEGLDTGDMIGSRSTFIDGKTAGDLHDELALMGAELLTEMLPDILAGTAPRKKQDDEKATYAPMLFKKDGLIDFQKTAIEIERQIRGLSPWPAAYTFYKDEQMKLLKGEVLEEAAGKGAERAAGEAPGAILEVGPQGITVATGEGRLLIVRIQMPGKRPLDVAEYIKGNKIEISTRLG